jgi:hypothetical protein
MNSLQSVFAGVDQLCETFATALQDAEFHNFRTLIIIVLLSWSLFGAKNDFG